MSDREDWEADRDRAGESWVGDIGDWEAAQEAPLTPLERASAAIAMINAAVLEMAEALEDTARRLRQETSQGDAMRKLLGEIQETHPDLDDAIEAAMSWVDTDAA